MLASIASATRLGVAKASPVSVGRVAKTQSRRQAAPKALIQQRTYAVRTDYYFHKYYPPTGVPTRPANEEPWDYMNRPKRRQGQLSRRLEKLIQLNDYYTIFHPEVAEPTPKPPLVAPEARDGMTVEKFLKTIGRGCGEYVDKFETWEKLFTTKSRALKDMGIPLRPRKWILHWTERYRQGDDPWYIPLRSKAAKNDYEKLEWRKKLVTQKERREEWGLD